MPSEGLGDNYIKRWELPEHFYFLPIAGFLRLPEKL
jgi:hypothetical protein